MNILNNTDNGCSFESQRPFEWKLHGPNVILMYVCVIFTSSTLRRLYVIKWPIYSVGQSTSLWLGELYDFIGRFDGHDCFAFQRLIRYPLVQIFYRVLFLVLLYNLLAQKIKIIIIIYLKLVGIFNI